MLAGCRVWALAGKTPAGLAAKLDSIWHEPHQRKGRNEARTMEILAPKASLPRCQAPRMFDAVRAEALFMSTLQPPAAGRPG